MLGATTCFVSDSAPIEDCCTRHCPSNGSVSRAALEMLGVVEALVGAAPVQQVLEGVSGEARSHFGQGPLSNVRSKSSIVFKSVSFLFVV
jgi:hypothetical protein